MPSSNPAKELLAELHQNLTQTVEAAAVAPVTPVGIIGCVFDDQRIASRQEDLD
jgi:hypothetical protein